MKMSQVDIIIIISRAPSLSGAEVREREKERERERERGERRERQCTDTEKRNREFFIDEGNRISDKGHPAQGTMELGRVTLKIGLRQAGWTRVERGSGDVHLARRNCNTTGISERTFVNKRQLDASL